MRWLVLFLMLPFAAAAQDRRPSHCIALAEAPGLEYVQPARFGQALDAYSVRLSYIDHATFVLETAGGLVAATDYTGFLGAVDVVPDVVTMNHAHDSHWTALPDTRIPHVLKGWSDGRVANDHHLDLGEMLVRNVATDIRSRVTGGVEKYGNSIFVFEVAGLCIGHLGHLHHMPDDAQFAALGRLDVVMAPVDGGLTLDLPTMIEVLKRLRSSVVIPMHYWGDASLRAFVSGMSAEFDIERRGGPSIELSARSLPRRPTVITLRPAFLRAQED